MLGQSGASRTPGAKPSRRDILLSMDNSAISKVFADVAVLMQAKGENIFKVRAHSKASDAVLSLPFQIRDIVDDADRLGEIPGFGKAIVEKTQELIRTGRLGLLVRYHGSLAEGTSGSLLRSRSRERLVSRSYMGR